MQFNNVWMSNKTQVECPPLNVHTIVRNIMKMENQDGWYGINYVCKNSTFIGADKDVRLFNKDEHLLNGY